MIEHPHFVCLSCGKIFDHPQKEKDCKSCKLSYFNKVTYDKCTLCGKEIIDKRYPVCPDCYYKNKTLDERLYQQFLANR
jgi:DNA-directed RNA polymerase subunit RPC12/RpoP